MDKGTVELTKVQELLALVSSASTAPDRFVQSESIWHGLTQWHSLYGHFYREAIDASISVDQQQVALLLIDRARWSFKRHI